MQEPLDPAADAIADQWEFRDPFPDIAPALLTAEQLFNYAKTTSLISPFSEVNIKGATYEVGIGGHAYYWDERKKRRRPSVVVEGKLGIELKPNSITFVETDIEFLLPQYIAIRFNLHIKLVHRGLLLGTGPIVDPGFRGKLLIPLHNLTSTSYTIEAGEKIIWTEFTKTAFGSASKAKGYIKKDEKFGCFPPGKRRLSADQYLWKANANNPIMSSISGFVAQTEERVARMEDKFDKWQLFSFPALFFTVILTIGSAAGLLFAALSVSNSNNQRVMALESRARAVDACVSAGQPAETCIRTQQ